MGIVLFTFGMKCRTTIKRSVMSC